jgi:ComF family protein
LPIFKSIAVAVLDLLFPPRCPFCDCLLDSPRAFACGACSDELARLDGAAAKTQYLDGCYSPFAYSGLVREAVLRYKFGGARDYGEPFGAAIASYLIEHNCAADIVTWVPLGDKRWRERGYNQAELMARPVARQLGLPAMPLLRRAKETAANSSLDGADARRDNVREAFEVVSPELLREKRVLIIDDVVTTGATLSECARALRIAGAESVVAATFAATQIGQK